MMNSILSNKEIMAAFDRMYLNKILRLCSGRQREFLRKQCPGKIARYMRKNYIE